VAATLTIMAIIGGSMFWVMSSESRPEHTPSHPVEQQARTDVVGRPTTPEDQQLPPPPAERPTGLEGKTVPMKEKLRPPREDKKAPPPVRTSPPADPVSIQLRLEKARGAYKTAVEKANTALLRRFEGIIQALAAVHKTEAAARLREERELFNAQGILFGRRPELKAATLEYGQALKSAREALALSYRDAIGEYTKLKKPDLAARLKGESDRLALDAPLVSLRGYMRNTYIQHADYLGWLRRVTSDQERLNATFELVPGLADVNGVSFRSINVPDHYLVHGDFRIRLQRSEDSDVYRKNGTFRRVKGLGAVDASSFESVNYPGYYIRAKGKALSIEKYDGTPQFRSDATFTIVGPQFPLW
jgi:hypothetical protein